MTRAKLSESALAAAVVAWLEAQHWDVYQEVAPAGGGTDTADIVAVRGPLVWVIECKTSLSLDVMDQSARWSTHLRSCAVPQPERRNAGVTTQRICKDFLGIGVLYVNGSNVSEWIAAPLMRHHHEGAKRLRAGLRPEHKTYAKAGAVNEQRYTPYRDTMEQVKRLLGGRRDGATLKEIMEHIGQGHYGTAASCRSSLPVVLEKFESAWCEIRYEGKERRFYIKGGKP